MQSAYHSSANRPPWGERGADPRDYATHGGGFPIFLVGTGCIGAITVSGLPERDDHMLVVGCSRII